MVMDPFDYIPFIGATVYINGVSGASSPFLMDARTEPIVAG
jgi:hypothetical protein